MLISPAVLKRLESTDDVPKVERLAKAFDTIPVGKSMIEFDNFVNRPQFATCGGIFKEVTRLSRTERKRMFTLVWLERIRKSYSGGRRENMYNGEDLAGTEEMDMATLVELCTDPDGHPSDEATDKLVQCLEQNRSIRKLKFYYKHSADLGLRRWFRIFSALGAAGTLVDLDLHAESVPDGGFRPDSPTSGWLAALLRPLKSLEHLSVRADPFDFFGIFRVVCKDLKHLKDLQVKMRRPRTVLDLTEAAVLKNHKHLELLFIADAIISPPLDAFRGPALGTVQLSMCTMKPNEWLELAKELPRDLLNLGIPHFDNPTDGVFDCIRHLPELRSLMVGHHSKELIGLLRECPWLERLGFTGFPLLAEDEADAMVAYLAQAKNLDKLSFETFGDLGSYKGSPKDARRTFLTVLRSLAKNASITELSFVLPHAIAENDPEIQRAFDQILFSPQSKLIHFSVKYKKKPVFFRLTKTFIGRHGLGRTGFIPVPRN